jgi:hypothetical protein
MAIYGFALSLGLMLAVIVVVARLHITAQPAQVEVRVPVHVE